MTSPACTGMEELYECADNGEKWAIAKAKEICDSCPLLTVCLERTLAYEGSDPASDRFSVAGGLSQKERFRLAKSRDIHRKRVLCRSCGDPLPDTAHPSAQYHPGVCKANAHTANVRRSEQRAKPQSEAAKAVVGGGVRGRRAS